MKYYKAEDVQRLINSLRCYGIPELNLEGLPTIEVEFCEDCKDAPYCEQYLVKTTVGDEIVDGWEVDFCQHGERINNE